MIINYTTKIPLKWMKNLDQDYSIEENLFSILLFNEWIHLLPFVLNFRLIYYMISILFELSYSASWIIDYLLAFRVKLPTDSHYVNAFLLKHSELLKWNSYFSLLNSVITKHWDTNSTYT